MARSRRARWVLAVVAAVLPAAIACNGLIGLDDFQKGECPGAICGDANFPDGFVPDGQLPDGSTDATIDVPRGAPPVAWARFAMPNYDASPALPNVPSYTNEGDAGVVITDNITNLVWRATLSTDATTEAQAEAFCAAIAPQTWRVPKRIELVTLLDYGQPTHPFIDTSYFQGFGNLSELWTSSPVLTYDGGLDGTKLWAVNFSTGAVEPLAPPDKAYVLCVEDK